MFDDLNGAGDAGDSKAGAKKAKSAAKAEKV
jgi:hypothetical protein